MNLNESGQDTEGIGERRGGRRKFVSAIFKYKFSKNN